MTQNRVIAVILLTFVVFWAYLTMQLPASTMIGEPGPKFFPSVILVLMGIFSFLLLVIKDKEKKDALKADDVDQEIEPEKPFSILSVFKLYGVFLGGIILIYFVGFNIGMIVSLTIMLGMIGWRIFPKAIIFSTSVTVAIYFLFDWLMRIPLPAGKLF